MRMRHMLTMASWPLLQLVAIALLSLSTFLQPCSCRPLDQREQRLETLLQKGAREGSSSEIICHLCEAGVALIKEYLEEGASVDDMFPVLEPLCIYFLNHSFSYYGPYMCPGVIHSYGPVLFYVLAERTLDPLEICQFVRLCNETREKGHSLPLLSPSLLKQSWERHRASTGSHRSLLSPVNSEGTRAEPVSNRRRESLKSPHKAGREGGDKRGDGITFLHLSDIHLDRQYAEGSPSLCNLYLCCRSWYNGTAPAGHYGNYECDLPLVTLDVVVETIAQLDPPPDFIIYTGDNSPHDLWNETWTSQFQATEYLVSYLSEKLPDIVIYPALGNHETFPESEYIGKLQQYQELTLKIAQYWQKENPNLPLSAVETIAEGGYYTLLIGSSLRLLSFNSDYGYSLNLYTLLNGQNPYVTRQQSWMIGVLEQAERDGEQVLMIAHVPPGDPGNTLHEYDEFYLNLTKRFHGTIVGHLFGHTHHDEFKLIQDQEGVYGTLLVTPSVTPRGRSNPSFRLFTMDPSSHQLLGYQQFHLNLTLANELAGKGVEPKMELAYTTSDLYHLSDLSPSSWATLVERFSQYPDLVSQYRYNKYGQSSSHDQSCDSQCLRETICTVSNIVNLERRKCIDG